MTQRYVYSPPRQRPKEPGEDLAWDEFIDKLLTAKRKDELTEKYVNDLDNSLTLSAKVLIELGISRPYLMTTQAAKMYLDLYEAQGVSAVSRSHMAQKLMTAFTWAFYEEVFASDRLATLKKQKIKKKSKGDRFIPTCVGKTLEACLLT